MALTLKIDITDEQETALKHDLIDPGQWIKDMVAGKISNCAKRMTAAALAAVQDGAIPLADLPDLKPATLAAALVAQPDYKDRAARDAAERQPLNEGPAVAATGSNESA